MAIMLFTLVLGLVLTYVLLVLFGLLGAAVADDVVQVVYVLANLWICSRLITLELGRLATTVLRTLMAATAMALPLLAVGTDHLSVLDWLVGSCVGTAAYLGTLLLTRELTVQELRAAAARIPLRALRS